MGLLSKDIKTLDDLFVHTLQDIYYAEQQITKALPQMIEKASDPQLKQAFQTHLGETEQQIKMVEQVFRMHGHDAKGVTWPAIDGIIDEAQEIAGEVEDPQVLDAALIAAAQAVEHYEITRYGTLVAWAGWAAGGAGGCWPQAKVRPAPSPATSASQRRLLSRDIPISHSLVRRTERVRLRMQVY